MGLTWSEINAFTTQEIVPKTTEVIFKQSPLLTRILNRRRVSFPGGTKIQRGIMYAELNGGFFEKGETFNIAYVKTDTAFEIAIKYAHVNVTLYGTDDVLNRGRNAAFSQVELKFANASLTMAKLLAQTMYKDGQTSGGTGVLSSSKHFDGLLAWIDDGNDYGSYSVATDSTKSFLAVGGITRDDLFATAPTFAGATTPDAGLAGANAYVDRNFAAFTALNLQTAFGKAWYGNDFPDIIVSTQTFWNKVWNTAQPNQRYFDDNSDVAKVGFRAFRFNGISDVVVDKYMPSDGTYGVALGLNTNYIEFYVTDNPKFQFGFTGFKDAQNSIDMAGQFLYAGNLLVSNPRTCFKLVGSAIL